MQCTNLHCIYLSFFGFVRIRRDAGKPLVNNQNQSDCVSIPYIPPHRKRSRVDYVRGISPRRDVLMKRRRTANYAVAEWHLIKGRVRAAGQRIHPSSTVLFTHKLNLNADSCHSFIIVSPPCSPRGDAIFLTSATLSLALPIVFDSKITS